jgi:hypothetical protein
VKRETVGCVYVKGVTKGKVVCVRVRV